KGTGDYQRLEIIRGAARLIEKYPLQGAGLGSALYFQEREHGKHINIIDNTGLWLLTETGIAGLAVFLACYAAMALACARGAGGLPGGLRNPRDLFALAALLMMLCFGVFSVFHEILYARFFWFATGLALAARPDDTPR